RQQYVRAVASVFPEGRESRLARCGYCGAVRFGRGHKVTAHLRNDESVSVSAVYRSGKSDRIAACGARIYFSHQKDSYFVASLTVEVVPVCLSYDWTRGLALGS